MWTIISVSLPAGTQIWASDGQAVVGVVRGGFGVSSRLIVSGLGFLDVVDLSSVFPFIPSNANFNNTVNLTYTDLVAPFALTIGSDGSFTATIHTASASGTLKPLPAIQPTDVANLDLMIATNHVPYQNIPDAPGKTTAEIRVLGQQFFPFTPARFELAMAVYDWTTADFTRMVFYNIFAYTSIGSPPYPLDLASIATAIWESNWGTYTPSNADYMNSFYMTPATSEADVLAQLEANYTTVQPLNTSELAVLAAACASMPRTSVIQQPLLYSGQVDIYQLGTEHFATEFLQFPLNSGPVGTPLEMPLQDALNTFLTVGSTLTTKMVWSFGSTMSEAMTYQNGIILIAAPRRQSMVWDEACYVTPLSDDPNKIEWVFSPGTSFLITSIETRTISGKDVVVISLEVQ
jgi:hypothetical protein